MIYKGFIFGYNQSHESREDYRNVNVFKKKLILIKFCRNISYIISAKGTGQTVIRYRPMDKLN